VKAVLWGRNVFDSIRKFVQFQLTVNVVAVIVAFVGAVGSGESPLKPVQMLWVNLIMDTMAALALATEAPTPSLLKRAPYGRYEGIITRSMWRNVIGQALYQLVVMFTLLMFAQNIPQLGLPASRAAWTEEHHELLTTIVFNTFVLCQLFNELNCRKLGNELNILSGLFTNTIFWAVMVFTVAVQAIIVQYGGEFASTHALTRDQWLFCIAVGAGSLPWGLILRIFIRPGAPVRPSGALPANVELRPVKKTLNEASREIVRMNSVVGALRRRSKYTAPDGSQVAL